jgi:iron complex outermembrane recepter protein
MFVGVAAMAMSAAPAFAADGNVAVEEIVVTGSRIQRPNIESPTPLQVVTPERMRAQGMANVSDILQTLPQFAPSFGGSRTQSTFSGTASSGLNVINLRNLGSTRSLVLINGRRAPSGTISSNAVDLNTLPSANISRIDVITGGASAVYGADAVSGVVNIITDRKFEGFEAGVSYGESLKHNDNQNPSAFARFGANFDRGHAGVTVEYDYQGFVSCADRYLCADDFAWFPPADPVRGPAGRSSVTPTGRYFTPGGAAASYTIINGQAVPFSIAAHGYNRNAQRTLAIPTERIMLAADADYKIANGLNAFVEINYGSSETKGPFEAHPFQSNTDLVGGVAEPSIPTNNPFIPASLRAAMAPSQTSITWSQRFSELAPRSSSNMRETTRIAAGFTGDFDAIAGFGKDWHYEASYVWGRTTWMARPRAWCRVRRSTRACASSPIRPVPASTCARTSSPAPRVASRSIRSTATTIRSAPIWSATAV